MRHCLFSALPVLAVSATDLPCFLGFPPSSVSVACLGPCLWAELPLFLGTSVKSWFLTHLSALKPLLVDPLVNIAAHCRTVSMVYRIYAGLWYSDTSYATTHLLRRGILASRDWHGVMVASYVSKHGA